MYKYKSPWTFNHREILECADLKFPVSGRSIARRPAGRIHTHLRNAVTLVWGSLRLAPKIIATCIEHATVHRANITHVTREYKAGEGVPCYSRLIN